MWWSTATSTSAPPTTATACASRKALWVTLKIGTPAAASSPICGRSSPIWTPPPPLRRGRRIRIIKGYRNQPCPVQVQQTYLEQLQALANKGYLHEKPETVLQKQ